MLDYENPTQPIFKLTWSTTVMSADRVRSRFWDVFDSTGRSCRSAVTQPISDQSGYSALVTRPIFGSVGLQCRPDPTGLRSDLNIIKPDSTGLSSTRYCNIQTLQIAVNITIYILLDVMGILIATRFVINCPLHRIMWPRITTMAQLDSIGKLDYENRARSIFKLTWSTM